MAKAVSPLRYPGGKTNIYPLVSTILRLNKLERKIYAEPFAGGCGLALSLLYGGHVGEICINDIDKPIWAFWQSVLNHTDEFVDLVENVPVTVEEWRHQREILLIRDETNPLKLGFAGFFLNRTNRSGIVEKAGVIGGLAQTGPYKLDCRFNRDNLIRRIRRIAKYRNRIHLYRLDALVFMAELRENLPSSTFFYLDPPYFNKGASLYTSFYSSTDHSILANYVLELSNPWIVTYDNEPRIKSLYRERRQFMYDINYSLETKRRGTEILIASKGLRVPPTLRDRQANRPHYRSAKKNASVRIK